MSAAQHLQAHFGVLTAQQRQVAEHVLAHPFEAATLAIDAMAARCQVSSATMNRFARALAYDSYSAFRRDWQQQVSGGVPPIDKLEQQRAQAAPARVRMHGVLGEAARQLRSADSLLDDAQLDAIARQLASAARIGVLGSDVSAYLAAYFVSYASVFRDGVEAISALGGASEAQRRVLALGPGDVLLALSLPRYSALTVELAALAHAGGATVIALTDSPASPVLAHAHHRLIAPAQHAVLPASSVGVLALLEGLCTLLAAQNHRSRDELLRRSRGASRFHIDPLPRRPRATTP